MKDDNILSLEESALDFLKKTRKDAKLTEEQLGKLAFPECDTPREKIHGIWTVHTFNKKRLRLRLGDFCAMCEALGKHPAQELFMLWSQNKQKITD